MAITRSIVIGDKKTEKTKADEVLSTTGTIKRANRIERTEARPPRVYNPDGKVLIIVESPAKSTTIEKFLGEGYVVKASMGHLRDLPKSQMGIAIEEDFKPRYNNIPSRRKLIEELTSEADKSSKVLLATDPDREGEAISWHLAHILNIDDTTDCRITFNEITNSAVQKAITEPRTIDKHMVDAQQARRVLDRIVGYKLSPLLWKKVCKGLSAGRVQSVAVRLISEREREIEAFIPEEYWTIEGTYENTGKKSTKNQFVAQLAQYEGKKIEIHNREEADQIQLALKGKEALVEKVETRKRSRKAPAPFTTSTLQQEGVRKLSFGAKKIMMLAQHLYEGKDIGGYGHVGLITYMRTDSTRISKEMQAATKDYIISVYGPEYYPEKPNVYGSKESAQDAHEAIRPTSLELNPDMVAHHLSRDELKLYRLIWNRYMASQMAPQQSQTVTATLVVDDYQLKSSGSTVIFKGFTEVYEETKKEEHELPLLEEGSTVKNLQVEGLQHFTQPPPRYTEASLIKTLEEDGIGRPSTYAPIIDTIISRNYVERKDKQFVPTELGFVVVDFLKAYFEQLINVNFTANLEKELDEIAGGKATYVEVLRQFYDMFSEELSGANAAEKVEVVSEASDEICEKCGSPMLYKFGRYGKFLACSNFPECQNTKPITVSTGVACPRCEKGTIVERKSKRGRLFYGCDQYPACDFTLWDKPTGEICSTCGSLMVEKTYKNGTVKKFCSNEACPTRPKKATRKKKQDASAETPVEGAVDATKESTAAE